MTQAILIVRLLGTTNLVSRHLYFLPITWLYKFHGLMREPESCEVTMRGENISSVPVFTREVHISSTSLVSRDKCYQAWQHVPVIPASGRLLRQEGLKVNLMSIVRLPSQKKGTKL